MIKIFKTQFVIPLLISICSLMGALYFFFDDFFLLFFPVCILALLAVPLVLRVKVDVFSMWSWMFYSSILGILLRCIYIYFDIPDKEAIDNVFLLGHTKSYLFPAMLLIFFGILFMTLGAIFFLLAMPLNIWSDKPFIRNTLLSCITATFAFLYLEKIDLYFKVDQFRGCIFWRLSSRK